MDDNPIHFNADSDEEDDWEEVEIADVEPQTLEITLNAQPKAEGTKKKSGLSHAERRMRIDCHKIHTVALLAHARMRNQWLNDELLQARVLSICPMKLQSAFAMIHKARIPDSNQRGRMFENAVRDLTDWWSGSFEILPEGHLRNRTFNAAQKIVERYRVLSNDDNSINSEMDLEVLQDALGEECEIIRSPKSLMKHLLMAKGSRDTSAQLFTALCRALAIPARLVVSLQSVPWHPGVGYPKSTHTKTKEPGKGKGKDKAASENTMSDFDESTEDQEMEEMTFTLSSSSKRNSKGKGKATDFPGTGQRLDGGSSVGKGKGKEKERPSIKLRKSRPRGQTLGSASPSADASYPYPHPTTTPPIYWTEVFSKPDGRWLPVDPIRSFVNMRKVFDPSPPSTTATANAAIAQFSRFNSPAPNKRAFTSSVNQENRLVYVLAFEEDGYARDVTRRYAREYGAKVAKMQGGSGAANMGGGAKGRMVWWNHVLSLVSRPYRLNRDDIEDEELEMAQMLEGMPTTLGGFKDHPVYVLARHLKQNEIIHPPPPSTPELGKFRGEPVYPRSAVVSLKSAENWMRSEGRIVKPGEQPLKMVKVRAGTVNKLRELEILKTAGTKGEGGPSGEVMQGMYARSQTERYVPDPVIDGIIPKNNFGNIDLYTPSMLPHGAAHIPYKGIAKIAKKLGFDFAEAVTGFEFKKQRAFPVIDGVVVAKENEEALLEAYWESERVAEEKARVKREERVIKQWTRLVQGLRIRQRLQEQYGTKNPDRATHADGPDHKEKNKGKAEQKGDAGGSQGDGSSIVEAGKNGRLQVEAEEEMPRNNIGGGYLIGADDVVEAFHLPKFQYVPNRPVLTFQTEASEHPPLPSVRSNNPSMMASVKKMELEEDSMSDAPDFITYDLDDEETNNNLNVDAEMNSMTTTANGTSDTFVPKTMAELAEHAAAQACQKDQQTDSSRGDSPSSSLIGQQPQLRRVRQQADQAGDENNIIGEVEDGIDSGGVVNANEQTTTSDMGTKAGSRRNLRTNRGSKRSKIASPRTSNIGGSTIPQRRRSTRVTLGRKRQRKDHSDAEDSEDGVSGSEDGDGDGGDDIDIDTEYNGGMSTKGSVKPRKKTRITNSSASRRTTRNLPMEQHDDTEVVYDVPVSTRTLRPRTSKKY